MDETRPRRRQTDWDPEDHDILIELRRDVANFISRIDRQFGDFNSSIIGMRTDNTQQFTEIRGRLAQLETWKHRIDGATVAGGQALAMAFAGGSVFMAGIGVLLKMTGHL